MKKNKERVAGVIWETVKEKKWLSLGIVLAVGGLGMMIPGTLTDVAGLVLVAAVIAYQKISAKKHGGPVVTA